MRRKLTMNACAVGKAALESGRHGAVMHPEVSAIPAGEVIEFIEYNNSDRVWVRWHHAVWSISLQAWSSADPVL